MQASREQFAHRPGSRSLPGIRTTVKMIWQRRLSLFFASHVQLARRVQVSIEQLEKKCFNKSGYASKPDRRRCSAAREGVDIDGSKHYPFFIEAFFFMNTVAFEGIPLWGKHKN
jgi:hypothetical protein